MAASIAYLVFFTAVPLPLPMVTAGLMLVGACYVLSKPSEVSGAQEGSS